MTRRLPLLLLAALALAAGLWSGMARIGWTWPGAPAVPVGAHGPLLVCGFFGTLIGLERAVALGRPWAYAAPALTGLGAAAYAAGCPVGAWAVAAGAAVLVAVFAAMLQRQRPLFLWTMAAGAGAWAVSTALWAHGAAVPDIVVGWMAFLVFTIVGERLELSRVLAPPPWLDVGATIFVGVLVASLLASALGFPVEGARAAGGAFVGLSAMLLRADVARHTVRLRGLPRFMAVALLLGYGWLAAGGALLLYAGHTVAGPLYDATLHAVFLGFAMSMVFAHAPVILPSVVGVPLPYEPRLYAPLILLHASVLLRVVGDLTGSAALRRWSGLFSVLALVLYAATALTGRLRASRARC